MAFPGRSYAYMSHLVSMNFQIWTPTPISRELLLAIFWEETLFNNIFQTGSGTAVGFGQTEPQEFFRFDPNHPDSGFAKKFNYLMPELPPRVPTSPGSKRVKITTALDDFTSVKVACAFVRDLFERGVKSKQSILNAYAGVGFTGPQPAHLQGNGRSRIVQGWLECERLLQQTQPHETAKILAALQKAKPFPNTPAFTNVLFPARESLEYG